MSETSATRAAELVNIARQTVAAPGGVQTVNMTQAVKDALDDAHAAIEDGLAARDQLERDRTELERKADLILPEGYRRLQRDAAAEGDRAIEDAARRYSEHVATLREALVDAALPRLRPEREGLARQELALLVSGNGPAAMSQAVEVAASGSAEAAAALLTPFGRSLLISHGVKGRDLEQALADVRTLAAQAALERGTDRERAAAEILNSSAFEQMPAAASAMRAAFDETLSRRDGDAAGRNF